MFTLGFEKTAGPIGKAINSMKTLSAASKKETRDLSAKALRNARRKDGKVGFMTVDNNKNVGGMVETGKSGKPKDWLIGTSYGADRAFEKLIRKK